jgi:hypothetical protein
MDDIEIAKNRIDLEHANLIEKRNAVYLVESSLLIGALTTFFTNLQVNAGLVLFVFLLMAFIFDSFRMKLDSGIQSKQIEISSLVSERNTS